MAQLTIVSLSKATPARMLPTLPMRMERITIAGKVAKMTKDGAILMNKMNKIPTLIMKFNRKFWSFQTLTQGLKRCVN